VWKRKRLSIKPEPVLTEANVTRAAVLLGEAVSKCLVEAEAYGTQFGMFALAVMVRSLVKRPLIVNLPSGLVFEAKNQSGIELPESFRTQDMMTTETKELEIHPFERKETIVSSVCIDMGRRAPEKGNCFTFATARQASPHIRQLIDSPLYVDLDVRIRQFAIWILRHNPPWFQLSAVGVLGAGLTNTERMKIQEVFKTIGIPTTEYTAALDPTHDDLLFARIYQSTVAQVSRRRLGNNRKS
jgi:hypothetical protein